MSATGDEPASTEPICERPDTFFETRTVTGPPPHPPGLYLTTLSPNVAWETDVSGSVANDAW